MVFTYKALQPNTGVSALYIYHSNQYFPKETDLYGKLYFITERRAAD
jgi:hypothetical protein